MPLNAHTHTRCLAPTGSFVRSMKQIFHSKLSNRGGSMLGLLAAAGSTIAPVKDHTYKLALKWTIPYLCVCVRVHERFPITPSPKNMSLLLYSLKLQSDS